MKLVYHPECKRHNDPSHPERHDRISELDLSNAVKPSTAEKEIKKLHSEDYIDRVISLSREEGVSDLGPDTYVCEGSYEAACYAAGAAIKASEIQGFSVARPPGHHSPFGGFCLFNNMAIAVQNLLNEGERVFVVDFDAHHGNGTQNFLKGKENVQYFSMHQYPFYPGTGRSSEKNCTNVTLSAGDGDEEFVRKIGETLPDLLTEFDPTVVGVSAGFDFMAGDPLTGLEMTCKSVSRICSLIDDFDRFFVLEGGYDSRNVRKGVETVLEYFS